MKRRRGSVRKRGQIGEGEGEKGEGEWKKGQRNIQKEYFSIK